MSVPKPKPLPRDIIVKVHAASINPTDYKNRSNFYGANVLPLKEPKIVGFDGSGVVAEVCTIYGDSIV
jgi:NADPH:quinone reductase-like Zn-dependent oxidoreductase